MRRIAPATLALALAVGCNDKPNPNPSLPPALQQPTAAASAARVDAVELVEGPLESLGLRLPLGSRPLTTINPTVFDVPAPVEHVERYLRARLESERVDRALGGQFTFERARLRKPGPSASGLPLRLVLLPSVAGSRLHLSEDATGLPVSSAEPSVPERDIILDQQRGRALRDAEQQQAASQPPGRGVPIPAGQDNPSALDPSQHLDLQGRNPFPAEPDPADERED